MKKFLRFLLWCIVAFFVTSIGATLYYKWMPVKYTPLMLIRGIEQWRQGQPQKRVHEWRDLSEISRQLPIAVMASEDQRYQRHHGFDLHAIADAVDERERTGRSRGASTISQQTAKNVFLWPNSTWVRKGLEAYFTVLIETFWGKKRIMEVYLNSIEMGPGIYGAEAVAREHFGCSARQLTREDCALIAATLPNPRRFSSLKPSPYMLKRQRWILKQMRSVKPIERDED
ncbi:MAG: monofunctional biosynthetic peptidoglycan transglycosylase [Alloprevotella sp.]|nr:monofunctional biosynthetic peptidoglycan transglycosylase [Alloprevotella sp.]